MRKPYLVKCREAVYDEEQGMLVLLCFFNEIGETRIVFFPRSDFHYKYPENEVPAIEMHRTAELFKGKPFSIVIDDDPERSKEAEEAPIQLGEDFRKRIVDQMEDVVDGLSDSDRQIARRLGGVLERDQKRQRIEKLLSEQMVVRSQLKDVDLGG